MTRIFEKSSWGIVYRKQGKKIEVLLLERENAKGEKEYVIPKGHIENEETAKDTALREISEETGLPQNELDIIKFMTKINYSFVASHKDGKPLINKDVYLFLVKYTGTQEPEPFKGHVDADKNSGERFLDFRWFSVEELKWLNVKPDIYSFIKKNLQYM